jgi:deoxyribodipyrimidine photolyase-related protein
VLGDQLDLDAAAFDGFDAGLDAVWMAEVADESTHVWSSKPRTVMFLAAMRHFALALQAAGRPLYYTRLDAPGNGGSLGTQLQADIERLRPARLVMTAPGDWRVLQVIKTLWPRPTGLPLDVREDRHFFSSIGEFAEHAKGRKSLRMEYFYREQRKRHGVLMEGDQPIGGQWNFDADNRESFGATARAPFHRARPSPPMPLTREVIALVNTRFATHPGRLDSFAWPVTRAQALQSLQAFIKERLPLFRPLPGRDVAGRPVAVPRAPVGGAQPEAAEPARSGGGSRCGLPRRARAAGQRRRLRSPDPRLARVRARHLLDPDAGYLERNALDAQEDLPAWYWTGATDMACLRDALAQTLAHGYANHIQRLMVTGLYALMLGVQPKQVHAWYLAVYVDAVEWVELPNTLGMSQYADGGVMGSKPYIATGKYIAAHEPALQGLPLRPRAAQRRQRLPVHHPVLGLPAAP